MNIFIKLAFTTSIVALASTASAQTQQAQSPYNIRLVGEVPAACIISTPTVRAATNLTIGTPGVAQTEIQINNFARVQNNSYQASGDWAGELEFAVTAFGRCTIRLSSARGGLTNLTNLAAEAIEYQASLSVSCPVSSNDCVSTVSGTRPSLGLANAPTQATVDQPNSQARVGFTGGNAPTVVSVGRYEDTLVLQINAGV